MRKWLTLFTILALILAEPVLAQEPLPRHPPVVPSAAVEPIAVLKLDAPDIAYLASIGAWQASRVVEETGSQAGRIASLGSALEDFSDAVREGKLDVANQYLNIMRQLLLSSPKGDLRLLASEVPAYLPACEMKAGLSYYYILASGQESPGSPAYCGAPNATVTSSSALDTILALLLLGGLEDNPDGLYKTVLVHVPPEAADPGVVAAILENRIGLDVLLNATREKLGAYNTSLVDHLLSIVANGTQEEAAAAVQELLELARSGKAPWEAYARALQIYQERFGSLPQQGEKKAKEVEVNVTNIAESLGDLVRRAEKARVSVSVKPKPPGPSIGVSLATPSPRLVYLLIAGVLGAAALGALRRSEADSVLRVLISRPPTSGSTRWCYSMLIRVLSIRGLGKEPWETPREYAKRVSGRLPEDVRSLLLLLTEAYETEEYGGLEVSIDESYCMSTLRRLMLPWRRLGAG